MRRSALIGTAVLTVCLVTLIAWLAFPEVRGLVFADPDGIGTELHNDPGNCLIDPTHSSGDCEGVIVAP